METNRINKRDINNRPIGYWDDDGDKCHYENINFGYDIVNRIGYYYNIEWQCHYIGDGMANEIGCERHKKLQYYYNKPGIKFGEIIEWK